MVAAEPIGAKPVVAAAAPKNILLVDTPWVVTSQSRLNRPARTEVPSPDALRLA
jgi:hypothetical protein